MLPQTEDNQFDVVFVIPFISRYVARDFARSSKILEATLSNLATQRDARVGTIVVSNDQPECDLFGAKFVKTDLAIASAGHKASQFVDKELKLFQGIKVAAQMSPKYIMAADADDIFAPRLAQTLSRQTADMVVFKSGWVFNAGTARAYPSFNIHKMCGSTLAWKSNLPGVPSTDSDWTSFDHPKLLETYWTVQGHKQDPQTLAKQKALSLKHVLSPLIFYRLWEDSTYSSQQGGNVSGGIKHLISPFGWQLVKHVDGVCLELE